MEIRFAKVEKDFINTDRLERFLVIDDEVYLSTIAGNERTLKREPGEDDEQAMKRIVRRTTENSHDIIYLDAFAQNNEVLLNEDQASNLLYRRWLARQEDDQDQHRSVMSPPGEQLKDGVFKMLRKKKG